MMKKPFNTSSLNPILKLDFKTVWFFDAASQLPQRTLILGGSSMHPDNLAEYKKVVIDLNLTRYDQCFYNYYFVLAQIGKKFKATIAIYG